jgi:ABC-type branched-subunit amino acid transport system substrate-binding protein
VLKPGDPQYFQDDLFATEYKKANSQPIDAFSAFGWSLMHITAEGLRRAEDDGKLTRDGVRDAIEGINGDLVTAMGKITYSPTKHRGVGQEAYTLVKIGPNVQYIPIAGY